MTQRCVPCPHASGLATSMQVGLTSNCQHLHLSAEGLSKNTGLLYPHIRQNRRANETLCPRSGNQPVKPHTHTHEMHPESPPGGFHSITLLGDTPFTGHLLLPVLCSNSPPLKHVQGSSLNYALCPTILVLASASGETHIKTKLKIELPDDATIPLLCIYPKKIKSVPPRDICTPCPLQYY